ISLSRAKTINGPIRIRVLSNSSRVTKQPVSRRRISNSMKADGRAMISGFGRQAKSVVTNVSLLGRYALLKIHFEWAGLFASRLAPTGDLCGAQDCMHTEDPMWE